MTMKKVVVIGGGTGQSALLRGLKKIDDIELTTIVTVADDGGSTGKLRSDLGLPAMGDVRNVMLALADAEDLMTTLMNYRFDQESGDMSGHNVGNIMLAALMKKNGNFIQSINDLSRVLKIKGTVYPCTVDYATISARMSDGTIVHGESNITAAHKKVEEVFYDQQVSAYPEAVRKILEADYIVIGIGSVYTSILPNLIIDGIREALIANTRARIVYYCNSMTEVGETDNYSVQMHVDALHRHIGANVIDIVVAAEDQLPPEVIESYATEDATKVEISDEPHDYKIYLHPLLSFENKLVRHDPLMVQESFERIMEEN
ncbi:MAG: YvcK family protein [Erysipelotrichaceae bacterium]|nr:YvcK family protein [Erysipelotrichaceae bacterium]